MTVTCRALAPLVGAALAVGLLGGCAAGVGPVSTPTAAFATEEEAFAAAEETYRAYTDALNDRRGGEETAKPLSFLIGSALRAELAANQSLEEEGLTLSGDVSIASFSPGHVDLDVVPIEIAASVCIDVSRTHVHLAGGGEVTPAERPPKISAELLFVAPSESEVYISESRSAGEAC